MPSLGPLEILVVSAVALIVFGPDKLPEIARTVGRAASELRRMATEVRSEFEMGIEDESDARPEPQAEPEPALDESAPDATEAQERPEG